MSEHRITNLWQSAKGTPYRLVELRKTWVDTLMSNVIESGFDEEQQDDIFDWIGNLKMNASQISTLWGFED